MRTGAKYKSFKTLTLDGVFKTGSIVELPNIKCNWKIVYVFWIRYTVYPNGSIYSQTHVKLKKMIK